MIWLSIAGSAIATYLTRSLPFVVTVHRRPPAAVARYLEALPVAIIAALVGPAVLVPGGTISSGAEPIAAALAAAAVAWRRSLLAGVIVGVVAVAAIRML